MSVSEQSCFVTLLTVELLIPHSRSLKDKRRVLQALKERIRSRFNASVAEVDYQNKWQRAALGVCLVGSDKRYLQSNTAQIRHLCEENADITITAIELQWL